MYPERWHLADPTLLNPRIRTSSDIREIFDAEVIVTDCWPNDALKGDLLPYQESAALRDKARKNVIFLPCPPVSRGQEVTADAMQHEACRRRQAKAYLLHAQNALMEYLTY